MEEAMQKEKDIGKKNKDRMEINTDIIMDGNKDIMKEEETKDFNVNTMKIEDMGEMIRKVNNDDKLHILENDASIAESTLKNEIEKDGESSEDKESEVNMDEVAELIKE